MFGVVIRIYCFFDTFEKAKHMEPKSEIFFTGIIYFDMLLSSGAEGPYEQYGSDLRCGEGSRRYGNRDDESW